ncbi:MAG: diguanylate cyclase, partial [Gammaproteobacteria bacterium]|nr:diguanylate cyclase [Gammaproteobacteria bacterium]
YKHSVDRKLRESEEKYRLAMDAAQDGLWDWEVTTGNVYYSPGWSRILGAETVGNTYSTWENRIHPADKALILNTLQLHLAGETATWNEEHRLRNADGVWIWVLGRGRVVKRDGDGKPLRMVGTMTDISDRKQAELEKEQLLHDMDGRVKELRCMYGITEATRKFTNLDDILDEAVRIIPQGWQCPEHTTARIILDDKEFVETPFTPTEWQLASDLIINNIYRGSVEVYYKKKFPELDECPFLKQERNLIDGITKTLSEAIEHKNAEAELKHLVTHDALTGLYNRKTLEQRVTNDILRTARYERTLSVFMIDIDHFKPINDTYGHQAGDTVLQSFAAVLNGSIRKTDYVVRYGGEEFVIVLPETPLPMAEELAERLRIGIAEHSILLAEGKELNIT